jgi:hypothetical protein
MAIQIPQSLGTAIARPMQEPQVAAANPLGEAVGRLGATGVNIATDVARTQTDLAEQRRRADSMLTLATTTNALHDAHDQVARGVLDGSIPTDKASTTFQEQARKIAGDSLQGYTPEQRTVMETHLTQSAGGLDRSLQGVVAKRQQQDTASTIDQFGEQVSREAMRQGPGWAIQKYGAMVDFTAGAAGLNPAQAEKLKQGFKEKVTYNFFETAGTAALTRGDPGALHDLMEQVQGPQGEDIDPKQRAQLQHQLFGWQQALLAKQDRAAQKQDDEARKRYNEAVDVFNKGADVALGGGYFSPEFITQMTQTAAGTEMQGQVRDLIASQRTVAGFASRPAPERAEILNGMRAQRATPGVGTDPLGDKLLKAAEQMDERLRTAANDNPWQAAQQAGRIQDAGMMSPSNPEQALQVLGERMKMLPGVEQWTGKRVSPFQPEEVEQIGKLVRALPIEQAATMLSRFGDMMGNSERVAAAAKQMHDKDGTLGLAMLFASAKTTEGRTTAELVLRGAQAEKDGVIKTDGVKETGWKATIANQIRGAYSNREVEDNVLRASFLIAGATTGDVDRAVRLATGGIIDFNGSKVPMPYGMAADGQSSGEKKFNKAIEALQPMDFMSQAPSGNVRVGPSVVSLNDFVKALPDAQLAHGGQGVYYVKAGAQFVTNDEGKPLAIRIAP